MSKILAVSFVLVSLLVCQGASEAAWIENVSSIYSEYSQGSAIPIAITAAPGIGDATITLTPSVLGYSTEVNIAAAPQSETEYLAIWRSDGFFTGDYTLSLNLETASGQTQTVTDALEITLNGPFGPFIAEMLDPNPAMVGKPIMVRKILQQFNPFPENLLGADLFQEGEANASLFLETNGGRVAFTQFENGLPVVPDVPTGTYSAVMTFSQVPGFEYTFKKPLKVVNVTTNSPINISHYTTGATDTIPKQLVVMFQVPDAEPAFGVVDLRIDSYSGDHDFDLSKIPLYKKSPHEFLLVMSLEGFDKRDDLYFDVFFQMMTDIKLAKTGYHIELSQNLPTPTHAEICRRNLTLLRRADYAGSVNGIPGEKYDPVLMGGYFFTERLLEYSLGEPSYYLHPLPECPDGGTYTVPWNFFGLKCSVGGNGTGSDSIWSRGDDHILYWVGDAVATLARFIKGSDEHCPNTLDQIAKAKEMWAFSNVGGSYDSPGSTDLAPYLITNSFPECPVGGTYNINAMSNSPTCTLGGRHRVGPDAYYETIYREENRAAGCRINLRNVERAKVLFSQEHSAEDSPIPDDLAPYMPKGPFPTCPGGASYQIHRLTLPITCTIGGGHRFDTFDFGMVPNYTAPMTDEVGPVVTNITISPPSGAVVRGEPIVITADVYDLPPVTSNIQSAQVREYYDGTVYGRAMRAVDGAFDSPVERVTVQVDSEFFLPEGDKPGFTIFARDASGNWSTGSASNYTKNEHYFSNDTLFFDWEVDSVTRTFIVQPGISGVTVKDGTQVQIVWEDDDPACDIKLRLYYVKAPLDAKSSPSFIAIDTIDQYPEGIKASDTANSYTWNVSSMPDGVYYVSLVKETRDDHDSKLAGLGLGPVVLAANDPGTATPTDTPEPTDTPTPTETPEDTPTATPTSPVVVDMSDVDANGDGIIDAQDLMLLQKFWHQQRQ